MLNDGSFVKWQSAKDRQIKSTFTCGSVFEEVDLSGYVLHFKYSMTPKEYSVKMTDIFHNSTLFNLHTLSFVMVESDIYLPSLDIFCTVRTGISVDRSALIKPCKIDVQFYKSEYVEIPLTKFLAAMLALRFIAMLYTLWLVYLRFRFRKVFPAAGFGISRDLI